MKSRNILVITALLVSLQAIAQTSPPLRGLRRPPEKLKIALTIDGADKVFIQGTNLWIVHETFQLPSDIKINGCKWDCQWNGNTSDKFTKIKPAFTPLAGTGVKVKKSKGRGGVQLVQKPTEENGFTACVQINDPDNASDRYELTLSWEK